MRETAQRFRFRHTVAPVLPRRTVDRITHFIEGSSGQLRKGGVTPTAMSAATYADDQTFMLVEIAADRLTFQTVARSARIVDSGEVRRVPDRPRSPS